MRSCKTLPAPTGGELIAIAYHNQAAAERKCIQQAGKEVDIHHGELVHNHSVRLERVARVTRENGAVVFRPFHFQQAVDRFCLLARQFRHPLCCSSRRRGKGNIQPVALKQGENALSVVVLPVPGPPVRISRPFWTAVVMARRCFSSY